MPAWLSIIIGVISAIGTIGGVLGVTSYMQERAKRKAQIRNREDDEAEELKQQAYENRLRNIIKEENQSLKDSIKDLKDQITKVEGASLSTIRDAITSCYYKCVAKGYRNDYDYENVHHMYENYVELHGNSYISDIIKRFDNLQVKEETVPTKVVARKTRLTEGKNKKES